MARSMPMLTKLSITSTDFSIFSLTRGSSASFHLPNTNSDLHPLWEIIAYSETQFRVGIRSQYLLYAF